jgi:repressor LexA
VVVNLFYEQLEKLCLQSNISMTNFVENELKMSRSNVTKWKDGKAPKSDTISKIATYFNVTADYLLTGTEPLKSLDERLGVIPVGIMHLIPIIGSVRCGFGGKAVEEQIGYDYANVKNPNEYVFFEVKGDSMAPDIKEGDLALVRQQPDIEKSNKAK